MSNIQTVKVGNGLLFPVVFTFAMLKLAGIVNISWWWIFSPYIFTFGIIGIILMVLGFYFSALALLRIVTDYQRKKKQKQRK